MKELQVGGKIDKGELIIFNEEVFYQQIMDIGFVNHVKITLEYGNKRTLNQNSYAWAVFTQMAVRMRQDGWEITKEMIYRKVEETYCSKEVANPETGKVEPFTEPLKEKDTDEFSEIVDTVRQNFMQQYPDTYIKEPHEYYGMSWTKYDKWKRGELSRTEAMKSN